MSNHIFNTQQMSLEDATNYIIEKKKSSLIDFSLVGRWLFLALNKDSKTYVVSCRLFKEVNQKEWKIEWFPPENPPQQFTCPEKILKLISPVEKHVQEWIDSCRNRKADGAKGRSEAKMKLDLLNSDAAKDILLSLDAGEFRYKGFYMKSKTEIIIEDITSNQLKRMKVSLLSLEQINKALSDKGE